MITQQQITANAISGKTARACESCLKSRARWFCPADDAFLCHACDSSVHSANELAGRHNRVRLQTASFKPPIHHDDHGGVMQKNNSHSMTSHLPTWHRGFQKKVRTPRNTKRVKSAQERLNMMPVVPEMSGDEGSVEEESEEQMVFSVPTFDPFEVIMPCDDHGELNISFIGFEVEGVVNDDWDNLPGFQNDLAEFAADVESLLEQGTDEEEVYSTVPLVTSRETNSKRLLPSEKGTLKNEAIVKVEKEEEEDVIMESCDDQHQFDWAMNLENEVLNFEASNCGGHVGEEDVEEEKKEVVVHREVEGELGSMEIEGKNNKRRKIFLRLNYEEVINSWSGSSPWTTGRRPEFHPDHDGWPNYMGGVDPLEGYYQGGGVIGVRKNMNGKDDGRQARVSRYREKRRTRLFSKKIRYQVRKLNAEKRPRLKGRFVKRSSVPPIIGLGPAFPYMNK